MNLLKVTFGIPLNLPSGSGSEAFGDAIPVVATLATPGVFTAEGFDPVNGEAVYLSFANPGGSMPAPLVAGTPYYIVAAANDTFELSATSGGAALATTSAGANLSLHVPAPDDIQIPLPFQPNNTVLAVNLGAAAVVLQSSPDGVNWTAIGSIAAGSMQLITIPDDWIGTVAAGSVYLISE
jgi:hypothetical protein